MKSLSLVSRNEAPAFGMLAEAVESLSNTDGLRLAGPSAPSA